MRIKSIAIICFLFFQVVNLTTISVTSIPGGDIDTPKTAIIGINTGNISANAAGGRFFFNFSIQADKSYDFHLTGDTDTKFDLFFFDSTFLPSVIVDDSAEYVDTNSYPVSIEGYISDDSWVMIQVFSNHVDGGLGDFTLTISEINTQQSSTSITLGSNSNTDLAQISDTDETPAFGIILATLSVIVTTAIFRFSRNKFGPLFGNF